MRGNEMHALSPHSSHSSILALMVRLLLILACVVLIVGGYVVRYLDKAVNGPQPVVAAAVQVDAPAASGRSMTLAVGSDGHFTATARISGRDLDFIVDTGASLVVLRESDAVRIGILRPRSEYTVSVSTANGTIKGARVRLDRIELGDIRVDNVEALVLPNQALAKNLLGMSFLSKLKRYEVANGRLVLEP